MLAQRTVLLHGTAHELRVYGAPFPVHDGCVALHRGRVHFRCKRIVLSEGTLARLIGGARSGTGSRGEQPLFGPPPPRARRRRAGGCVAQYAARPVQRAAKHQGDHSRAAALV
eukprot:scaffold5660_cov323-Prasinococcus_capsulatus_cf.AAC.4